MSRIASTDRLTRLVAAIPWIVAQDGVHVDEIATRFDYPRQLLLDDLHNVVFFVGVPPYTPDTLIEVQIDDDMVWIDYAEWFSRPMRLTGGEALSLLAAGETVLALDTRGEADAPLARGLAKLRLATGTGSNALAVQLGAAEESILRDLRSAVEAGVAVDISYYSFARNERTERRIEPRRFFAEDGHWYVGAYCHRAGGDRVFRVDRIDSLAITDQRAATADVDLPEVSFSIDEQPRVTIRLPVDRAVLLDHVAIDEIADLGDGRLEVTLPVSSVRWLDRLALRIGAGVEIVAVDEALGPVAIGRAATDLADRYR